MTRPWTTQKQTVSVAGTALNAGTETVVATLGGISTQTADANVNIEGVAVITTAAGATTATVRIRRDSLTGAQVASNGAEGVVASTNLDLNIQATDNPGEVAGQVYVLTVQLAGGNATNFSSSLQANY